MTISDELEAIRSALYNWANPIGGDVSIVSNFKELWRQAAMSSQKPRVLIAFTGKKMRGNPNIAALLGRSDRSFSVAITRGRGFSANRGDSLVKKVGNADPFLDDVEAAENVIRNLPVLPDPAGISAEYPINFKGSKAMQLGNLVIDGYMIEFTTANDEPALTTKSN